MSVPVPNSMSGRECQIPARRGAISDLAVARTASSEDFFDFARDRVDLGHSVDRSEDPAVTIIQMGMRRLTMIALAPRLDRLRPVIGAACELTAIANVADPVDL